MTCSEKQHVPLDTYVSNLRRIVQHVHDTRANTTIIITPPPISEPARKIDRQRKWGASAATEMPERTNIMTGIGMLHPRVAGLQACQLQNNAPQ